VHDINDLELRGVPSLFVASSEFVEAARSQSEALGFAAPVVFVPHPIQDRTDDEMRVIADEAVPTILAKIIGH
jgi:hypothetical protein